MDYQSFVKTINKIACIISIKINPDGTNGDLCIEAANDLYLKSVNVDPKDFVPGRPYYEYILRNMSFEGLSKRSFLGNILLHNYVYDENYKGWLDVYFLPLVSDRDDVRYGLFSYDMTLESDSQKISDVTPEAAVRAIKTSVMLRESPDFEKTMQTVIENIRKDCKATGCALILTDFEAKTFKFLAQSLDIDENRQNLKEFDEGSFFNVIEIWDKLIAGENCFLIIDNLDAVKEKSKEWYDSMVLLGINRLALYPLRANGETIGYFWVTNFDTSNMLHTRQTLELTSFLLASEVSNHKLYKQMEKVSVTDLLTETYNRNAMNNKIMNIVDGKYKIKDHYGVVFVDVNGLKTVNDNEGHLAGDNLLKETARVLKETFKNCDIYRVGGDEFLILVENKPEDEFNNMIEKVRDISDKSKTIKLAIGSCYEDASFDIRKAMHLADVKMYEDKSQFYMNHPELSRTKNALTDNNE